MMSADPKRPSLRAVVLNAVAGCAVVAMALLGAPPASYADDGPAVGVPVPSSIPDSSRSADPGAAAVPDSSQSSPPDAGVGASPNAGQSPPADPGAAENVAPDPVSVPASATSDTSVPAIVSSDAPVPAITSSDALAVVSSDAPAVVSSDAPAVVSSDAPAVVPNEVQAPAVPPVITSGSLPVALVGVAYSFRFTANESVSWSATGVPAGFAFDPQAGLLTGVPTTEGMFSLFITATNSDGATVSQGDYLTVSPNVVISSGPRITSGRMPDGEVGVSYSYTFTADQPVTWSATHVPEGLSFDPQSGLVTGAPTANGTFTLLVTATATAPTGGSSITGVTLVVTPKIVVSSGPTITSATLPSASVGDTYRFQLTADETVSWQVSGLPPGLFFDASTGLISGTLSTAGDYDIVVVAIATDGSTASEITTVHISPAPVIPPVITSGPPPAGAVGVPYSYAITASGTPFAFLADGLPDGLSVNHATGLISGTPTTAGSYSVTLRVLDDTKTVTNTRVVELDIVPAPVPHITSGALPDATLGESYAFTVTASNDPFAFLADGLPDGLTISHSTGVISGTPTTTGTFSVTVAVIDSSRARTDVKTYPLNVLAAPILTSGPPPAATVGDAYSFQLVSSVSAVTYAVTGLPDGLTVDRNGLISGTPTKAGEATLVVTLTDANHVSTVPVEYVLRVDPASTTPPPPTTTTHTPPATGASTATGSDEGRSTPSAPTVAQNSPSSAHAADGRSEGARSLAETGQNSTAQATAGALGLFLLIVGAAFVTRRIRTPKQRR